MEPQPAAFPGRSNSEDHLAVPAGLLSFAASLGDSDLYVPSALYVSELGGHLLRGGNV